MNALHVLPEQMTQRLAWGLVHFVWQGAAVAVLLAAILWLGRIRRPATRYACCLIALLVMAACPVVTFVRIQPAPAASESRLAASGVAVGDQGAGLPLFKIGGHDSLSVRETDVGPFRKTTDPAPLDDPNDDGADGAPPLVTDSPAVLPNLSVMPVTHEALPVRSNWSRVQPWIVSGWLLGVAALSLRLLLGWVGVWRLRRRVEPVPESLAERVEFLARALRVTQPLIHLSHRVTEAIAVGFLRPMILLPAAWVTELPPDMIEAVIAHELAHIRRGDLWVNLFQRLIETLLFYHPAVWWLSRRLRIERELCCDELVVRTLHNPLRYAETLEHIGRLSLADARGLAHQPLPARSMLTVSIGSPPSVLLNRIRAILNLPAREQNSHAWLAGLIPLALACLAGWSLAARQLTPVTAEPRDAPAAVSASAEPAQSEPPALSNDNCPGNFVEAPGTYRGRVVTEDGSPLPPDLKLWRRVSSEETRETPVDPNGEFSFGTDPARESVRFSMTATGFAPFDSNWLKFAEPITLKLSRGATVGLHLIAPAGPVTGSAALSVPWWDNNEQGTFPVDANGIVTMARCPKTTVKIDLLVPGFEEVRVHRWVRGDVTLDVPLQPAKPTRLRIVSAKDGSPIAGARVRLFSRTRAGSFLTPFQHHGDGPIWGESNAEGRVELTTLRAIDPVPTNDPGAALYAFRIDAPNHAPCYIGDVRAGSELGEIQVGDSLEVRGEVVRDAAKPERISLQIRQPTVAQGGKDGHGGWKNVELNEVDGKVAFHLTGLQAGPFDMFIVYSDASEPPNSLRGTIKQLQFHGLLNGSSSNLVITRESVVPGDTLLTARRASLFPIDDHPPSNVPDNVSKLLVAGWHTVEAADGKTALQENKPTFQPLFVWSSTSPVQHSMGHVDWRVFVLQDGTVFIPGSQNYEAGTHHKLPAAELQELKNLLEKHRDLFGRQVPKELPQFAGWRHGHESLLYTKEGETKAFVKWYGLEQPPMVGEFDPDESHKALTEFISRLMTDAACGGRQAKAKYRELANKALTAVLPKATPFHEATWTNTVNGTDGTRTIRFANTDERTEVTLIHSAFGEVYVERIEQFDKRLALDSQLLGVQGKADAPFVPNREAGPTQVANQRGRTALQEITEIEINETPLTDALTYLSDLHNIPVELDATAVRALKEPDTKLVTLDLRGDELSAGLMLLLHPFDLSYLAEGDRLVIATPDEVRRRGAAVPQTLRQVLNSLATYPGIRWEAILLGKIEAADFEIVPRIVTALSDKDLVVQRAAAAALHRLAEGAISAIPTLQTLSKSDDARLRFAACRALIAIGHDDLRTLPWLVEAWSRDPVVRDRWVPLVRQYSDRVFDEFVKLYPNADREFRKALLLAAYGRAEVAEQLILLGLTDTDDKLRHAAVRSMLRTRPTEAQQPALRALLRDQQTITRVLAAQLLLPLEGDSPAARDVLLKAIADGSDFEKGVAIVTFNQLPRGADAQRLIRQLNELLQNGPEVLQRSAWIALAVMQKPSQHHRTDQSWGPTAEGLRTRLSLVSKSPTLGESIKLRLEVENVGREEQTYENRANAVEGVLKLIGPDGKKLADAAISFSTRDFPKTLNAGGMLICEVELHTAKQLRLSKAGQFLCQFCGKNLPPSNVLMVDVTLEPAEQDQDARAKQNGLQAPLKSSISEPVEERAKPPGEEAPDPDRARRTNAVERAVGFLKSQQREDGTWMDSGSMTGGTTALATVALLQAGVKVDDAVIQKALPEVRKVEPKMIYVVALQTMALCVAAPQDDAELIRRNVEWIENAQVKEGDATGGWSYLANPGGRADGSCSRFAILGLDAAQRAKFEVRAETWQRVATYWLKSQKENGCWGYLRESSPTFTMSLAGVAGLATAHRHLPQDDQAAAREAAIRKPHEFIAKVIPSISSSWLFYTFHCLERAGHLTDTVRFGGVDWKSVVTKRLIDHQRHDGAWGGPNATENELIATSFALMFLSGRPEDRGDGKPDGAAKPKEGDARWDARRGQATLVEQKTPVGTEFVGRVIDAEGRPVEGAELSVFVSEERPSEAPPKRVQTTKADANGVFRATVPQQDALATVWATAAGKGIGVRPVTARGAPPNAEGLPDETVAEESPDRFVIRLNAKAGPVRVIDPANKPVAGAKVTVKLMRTYQSPFNRQKLAEWYARKTGQPVNEILATMMEPSHFAVPPVELKSFFEGATTAEGVASLTGLTADQIRVVEVETENFGRQAVSLDSLYEGQPDGYVFRLSPVGRLEGEVSVDPHVLAAGFQLGGFKPSFKTSVPNVARKRLEEVDRRGPPGDRDAYPHVEGRADVVLDASGRFSIPMIAAGFVALVDPLPQDSPYYVDLLNVRLEAGKTVSLKIPVHKGVLVRGVVRKRGSHEPVAGRSVNLTSFQGIFRMQRIKYVRTDEAGRFEGYVRSGPLEYWLNGAVEGFTTVHAFEHGHARASSGMHYFVPDNVDGAELPPLELVAIKSRTGRLLDEQGNPAEPNWDVHGFPTESRWQSAHGVTKEGGEFTLSFPEPYPPTSFTARQDAWRAKPNTDMRRHALKIVSEEPFVVQMTGKERLSPALRADGSPTTVEAGPGMKRTRKERLAAHDREAAKKLLGDWKLTFPRGFVYQTKLEQRPDGLLNLSGAVALNGVYAFSRNRLELMETFNDGARDFVWKLQDDGTLKLIEEDHSAGAEYIGALLSRKDGKRADAGPVLNPAPLKLLPVEKLIANVTTQELKLTHPEATPQLTGQKTFVAIRGLVPHKRQIEQYVRFSGEPFDEVQRRWEALDFVIERQESSEAQPEWDRIVWKPLPIKSLLDVLAAVDFAPDVVQPAQADPVFTSSIPTVVTEAPGFDKLKWDRLATHPDLTKSPENEIADDKLFRLYDFSVRADAAYRYRVRVQYLCSDKNDRNVIEFTPFSQPTPVVRGTPDLAEQTSRAEPKPGQAGHGVVLSVRGRVMIDGPIPKVPPIKGPFFRGTMPRRNANGEMIQPPATAIAGTNVEFPDDTLVISREGGIAYVAVYLKKAPKDWKPTPPPGEPVVIEAVKHRFTPHFSFIRTGQPLKLVNSMNEAVNFHSQPLRGTPQNQPVNAQNNLLMKSLYTQSESLPHQFVSDIQHWMKGYLLALDHPFAAITDADGRFEIRDLPAGVHHFTVWHERRGYLNKDLVAFVDDGEVTEVELKYTAEQLERRDAATVAAQRTGVSVLPEHSDLAVVKLVREFGEHFAKQRFAEAEIAAKRAKELDPMTPQLNRLRQIAAFARRKAKGDDIPPVRPPLTIEFVERLMKRGERLEANDRAAAAKLVGRWKLTISGRDVYEAEFKQADDGTLLLTGHPNLSVSSGRFARIAKRLELVEHSDTNFHDLIWHVKSDNRLTLIVDEDEVGGKYLGATLERIAAK